jgi:hypothetical protein
MKTHHQLPSLCFLLLGLSNQFQICSSFSATNAKSGHGRHNIKQHNHIISEDDHQEHVRSASGIFASFCLASLVTFNVAPLPAIAAVDDAQGIGAVTQSQLGQSVRRSVVGGAQLVDTIDLKWERFSDSRRDEKKCDPRTNRRMFDNGTRRDGTKIGNPVLGALCTPEPLRAFDSEFASLVTKLAANAMDDVTGLGLSQIERKVEQVKEKVGPSFSRAASSTESASSDEDNEQAQKRQTFNRDLYAQMRAYGEMIPKRESSRALEKMWGGKLLATLAPTANRNDYSSLFPKPDPSDEQPYDEGALLDALGGVSVALNKLQEAGLIGHWEISIPEDDYWNVVTLAIDDDISMGGQILSRESRLPLSGSAVVALVRSAMEDKAKIPYKMDTFFIDPTTTRQELYNPTQLLVSLSDLGQ